MVIPSFLGCEDCKRKKIDQVFSLAIGRGKSLTKANRWAGGEAQVLEWQCLHRV